MTPEQSIINQLFSNWLDENYFKTRIVFSVGFITLSFLSMIGILCMMFVNKTLAPITVSLIIVTFVWKWLYNYWMDIKIEEWKSKFQK